MSFLAVIYLTMAFKFASVNHVCIGKAVKAKFFCFTKLRQFSIDSFFTFSQFYILSFPVHNQHIILKFSWSILPSLLSSRSKCIRLESLCFEDDFSNSFFYFSSAFIINRIGFCASDNLSSSQWEHSKRSTLFS